MYMKLAFLDSLQDHYYASMQMSAVVLVASRLHPVRHLPKLEKSSWSQLRPTPLLCRCHDALCSSSIQSLLVLPWAAEISPLRTFYLLRLAGTKHVEKHSSRRCLHSHLFHSNYWNQCASLSRHPGHFDLDVS